VALAARIRGIKAHIVVPRNVPACKLENVKRYGGQITLCEPSLEARQKEAARIQQSTGAVRYHQVCYLTLGFLSTTVLLRTHSMQETKALFLLIWKKMHTLDDTYCCSGQGTVALEFLEQVPLLDAIIVPISGMYSNITKAM
jgi:serine racemase